ncbi:MAG TPA: hypothetical protein VGJ11_03810 [Gaiellales bacterium]|jgi:hypothetical protein
MLRRTIALALAGLAIAAPSALAKSHWNSQMKSGTATASRSAGGCTLTNRSHGTLAVSCNRSDHATLTYSFPLSKGSSINGTPWCRVNWAGLAEVHRSCKIVSGTLRVTVTVTDGSATISTVNVGYYT